MFVSGYRKRTTRTRDDGSLQQSVSTYTVSRGISTVVLVLDYQQEFPAKNNQGHAWEITIMIQREGGTFGNYGRKLKE